jgi:4-diphosphocytidyl-2-C-methyl-D-erythritol kinase
MEPITITAPAKVNLNLHIVGRREDGYHLLDSLVVFEKSFYDRITFKRAGGFFLNAKDSSLKNNNLIEKAINLLAEYTNNQDVKNWQIELKKNLPISAGIGGGSSNAAVTLNFINDYFKLNIPIKKLEELALKIGSDVPACLHQKPLIMSGIGEKIDILKQPLPPFKLILKTPAIRVDTKEIFSEFKKQQKPFSLKKNNLKKLNNIKKLDELIDYLKDTENSLQAITTHNYFQVNDTLKELQAMEGCLLARMSGSGGTCFGIFKP